MALGESGIAAGECQAANPPNLGANLFTQRADDVSAVSREGRMPVLATLIRDATCCNIVADGQGFAFTARDGEIEAFSALVRRAKHDLGSDYMVFATPSGPGQYSEMFVLPLDL